MSRQIGMHIGGKEVAAVGGQWFDTVDPFTGQVCEVALGDTRDVQPRDRRRVCSVSAVAIVTGASLGIGRAIARAPGTARMPCGRQLHRQRGRSGAHRPRDRGGRRNRDRHAGGRLDGRRYRRAVRVHRGAVRPDRHRRRQRRRGDHRQPRSRRDRGGLRSSVRVEHQGAFFTLQRAGRLVADGGRILWIGSSSSYGPSRGLGLYGSSKMAPRYVVEVLAQRSGRAT